MRNRLRPRLSYANATATLALAAVLTGGAYAAVSGIPDAKGVFHGCVTKKTGALRVVKPTAHCRHGKKNKEFAIIWNQKGHPGAAGRSALTPLRTGESESGEAGGTSDVTNGSNYYFPQTFPIPLKDILDSSHVVYTSGSAPHCSGVGNADPGYLCVYQESIDLFSTPTSADVVNVAGSSGADAQGFWLKATASGTGGGAEITALWTVTGG